MNFSGKHFKVTDICLYKRVPYPWFKKWLWIHISTLIPVETINNTKNNYLKTTTGMQNQCVGEGAAKKPIHKDLCSMLKENLLYENNESTQQPHPNHVSKAHLVEGNTNLARIRSINNTQTEQYERNKRIDKWFLDHCYSWVDTFNQSIGLRLGGAPWSVFSC